MAIVVVGDSVFKAEKQTLSEIFGRITGRIFSLLPTREEGNDWCKPLDTLIVEVSGLTLFLPDDNRVISLASKLNGLKNENVKDDFMVFRRTIFETCGIADAIKESLEDDSDVSGNDEDED